MTSKIMNRSMTDIVAQQLRETIIRLGLNPDHRANYNRARCVLRDFAKEVMRLTSSDFYGCETLSRSLDRVIDEKLG